MFTSLQELHFHPRNLKVKSKEAPCFWQLHELPRPHREESTPPRVVKQKPEGRNEGTVGSEGPRRHASSSGNENSGWSCSRRNNDFALRESRDHPGT